MIHYSHGQLLMAMSWPSFHMSIRTVEMSLRADILLNGTSIKNRLRHFHSAFGGHRWYMLLSSPQCVRHQKKRIQQTDTDHNVRLEPVPLSLFLFHLRLQGRTARDGSFWTSLLLSTSDMSSRAMRRILTKREGAGGWREAEGSKTRVRGSR